MEVVIQRVLSKAKIRDTPGCAGVPGNKIKSITGISTKQCSDSNNPAAQVTVMKQRKLPTINLNQFILSRIAIHLNQTQTHAQGGILTYTWYMLVICS